MLNKNREIFAVLFIFVIVASFIALYFNFRSKDFSKSTSFVLYYYDPVTKEIVPVSKDVALKEDNVSNVYTLFDLLKNPDSTKLFPLIDANCNLRAVKISGTLCTVDFTFQKGKPQLYSVSRESAAVYGLVNTLTGLNGISEIQILVDGKPSQYFYHYIEIDKPLMHFDSMLPKGRSVNLYFSTQDLNVLVVENREVFDSDDPVVFGYAVLKELFYGSMYGLPQLISGDYLNNFSIKSGGIATLDFKEDILKNSVGAHEESLFIFSIVDTLTELPDITSVQITVGGHIIPSLFGSVDISTPLTRFMINLNKYLIPYYVYNFNGNTFYVPVLAKYGRLSYDDLFSLLKTPDTYATMLPQDAKLVSYKLNGDTLELVVGLGNISGDDLEILKRQIALSYTEFPGVRKVTLTIGEESFILGR